MGREGRFMLSDTTNRSCSVNKVQRLQAIYKRVAKDDTKFANNNSRNGAIHKRPAIMSRV